MAVYSGTSTHLSRVSTYFRSILRIVVGFLFLCHGAQKIFGVFGGNKMPMVSYLGLAGILECIGGTLILLGLFTRVTAFILCGEMAFAYFMMHAKRGPMPIANGGELAVLYCFIFLYLIFAGAGIFSMDAMIRKRQ
jgi:putative oxidoreductase